MATPPKAGSLSSVSVPSLRCESRETESLFCPLQGGKGRIGVVISSYMHFTNVSARYEGRPHCPGRRKLWDGVGGSAGPRGGENAPLVVGAAEKDVQVSD